MSTKPVKGPQDLVRAIKKRRQELGISQKELAALCNLSHNGISKMESNESEIRLSTLFKISKFLGMRLLVEMENEKT